MRSPWGNRGEICKTYGWTYDYLLWHISWVNVQMMLADAARMRDDDNEDGGDGKPVVHRELSTKEDIKKYIKGII